jgi:hypothetical protein
MEKKWPFYLQNGGYMAFFTAKEPILELQAMIGTGDVDIQWDIVHIDYANALLEAGIVEDRGVLEVNGILYRRFYLPYPPHFHEYE